MCYSMPAFVVIVSISSAKFLFCCNMLHHRCEWRTSFMLITCMICQPLLCYQRVQHFEKTSVKYVFMRFFSTWWNLWISFVALWTTTIRGQTSTNRSITANFCLALQACLVCCVCLGFCQGHQLTKPLRLHVSVLHNGYLCRHCNCN